MVIVGPTCHKLYAWNQSARLFWVCIFHFCCCFIFLSLFLKSYFWHLVMVLIFFFLSEEKQFIGLKYSCVNKTHHVVYTSCMEFILGNLTFCNSKLPFVLQTPPWLGMEKIKWFLFMQAETHKCNNIWHHLWSVYLALRCFRVRSK